MAAVPFSWAMWLLRNCPPWLRRTFSAPVMLGIGDVLQGVVDSTFRGIRARFPYDDADPAALALIGSERRMRRGPQEPAATYARRIRGWWDAHRRRGGPYALLEQLYAFFRDTYDVRIDVVAQSGNRHHIEAGGGGVIIHDAITWGGDGSGQWAHAWVFFYLTSIDDEVVLASGDHLITDAGDRITVSTLFSGTITPADAETFLAVPREWSAAHLPYITVVLLYGVARLWNYPQPPPTWTAWGASGAMWGSPEPVILVTEET